MIVLLETNVKKKTYRWDLLDIAILLQSSDYQWRNARCNAYLTCREHIGKTGGRNDLAVHGGGESVTDPESSKSKVISSVLLFLLSPFYGSPRSFFLPDRGSRSSSLSVLDSVFLSFSFHFPFTLLTLLYVSRFYGAPLNLRSLWLT